MPRMPLRAFQDDRELLAPALTDAAWSALREASLRMSCCRADGYARTSGRGTRHFVHHRRGACAWAPESELHLAAKAALVEACLAAGYPVRTEAAGPDWRADVLCRGPRGPVAFEVQVTPVPLAELERRQARYARDGVAGWWLMPEPPATYAPRPDLPVFCLREEGGRLHAAPVAPAGVAVLLADWARAVAGGRCAWRREAVAAREQEVELLLLPERCRTCRAVNHLFAPARGYTSACGLEIWPGADGPLLDRVAGLRLRPELAAALRPQPGLSLPASRLVSDGGRPYRALACAMCGRPFGHAEFRAVAAALHAGTPPSARLTVRVQARDARAPLPHWCARC